MSGLGVDLHPYYQRGTNALPNVEYGWIKMADGTAKYSKQADGKLWTADAHAALFRRLGIPFGGYVFAQPGTDGARAFDVLWAECQRLGGTGVAPADDVEGPGWNPTNAAAHGRAFCARARARGVRPAIYMDLDLLQLCRPDRWPEDPVIWAPRYSGKRPQDGGRYVGRYDVHQYTSSGTLPGSAGMVDMNQAYNTAFLLGKEHEVELDDDVVLWDGKSTAKVKNCLASVIGHGANMDNKINQTNAKLDALLAKASGASADEVAAKLLPALTTAMATAVASIDVSELDKLSDDDVSRIVDATVTHAGDLLSGRSS